MDRGAPRHRVAIFGGGRVGVAMQLEMTEVVPVIGRESDCACDVACICWPAHAIRGFAATHPLGAQGVKVAFCNGAWAVEDGADHAGICYVRATVRGEWNSNDRKAWRVGRSDVADALSGAGLGVICTSGRGDHQHYVWSKCLYILPLALACEDVRCDARDVVVTDAYAEWYDIVRWAAVKAIGEEAVAGQEARVRFLTERSPRGWLPSPSHEELDYFKERLCVA
jgi:hypothetical protein